MSHLRLVHSAPRGLTRPLSCREAFESELGFVVASLERMGARAEEKTRLADEVFRLMKSAWPTHTPSRPLRPFLLGLAAQVLCADRDRDSRRLVRSLIEAQDSVAPPPWNVDGDQVVRTGCSIPRPVEVTVARAGVPASEAHAPEVNGGPARAIRLRSWVLFAGVLTLAFVMGDAGTQIVLHRHGPRRDPAGATRPGEGDGRPPGVPAPNRGSHASPTIGEKMTGEKMTGERSSPAAATGAPATRDELCRTELECLRWAWTAFLGRDYQPALDALQEHDRRFPSGGLAEEREARRGLALAGARRAADSRRAAVAFAERFPHSPLLFSLREPRN